MAKISKSIKGPKTKPTKGSVTAKGTIKKSVKETGDTVIFVPRPQPADIILTKTQVELSGSKIKIFGDTKNLLAIFDSKTATFTVSKKLMLGRTDVGAKLRDLEARIQELES